MLTSFVIKLIYIYCWIISPFTRPSCRFVPTCSSYAITALELHGLVKGVKMTFRRFFRCHPLAKDADKWQYDPVPESNSNLYNKHSY